MALLVWKMFYAAEFLSARVQAAIDQQFQFYIRLGNAIRQCWMKYSLLELPLLLPPSAHSISLSPCPYPNFIGAMEQKQSIYFKWQIKWFSICWVCTNSSSCTIEREKTIWSYCQRSPSPTNSLDQYLCKMQLKTFPLRIDIQLNSKRLEYYYYYVRNVVKRILERLNNIATKHLAVFHFWHALNCCNLTMVLLGFDFGHNFI